MLFDFVGQVAALVDASAPPIDVVALHSKLAAEAGTEHVVGSQSAARLRCPAWLLTAVVHDDRGAAANDSVNDAAKESSERK